MNTPVKILLIEDDPDLGPVLQRTLSDEGYEVLLAERGEAGLEQIQQAAFDLLITDMKLPGLSGLDLVRQLHRTRPRLPIILMTAHGTTETAIEAMQGGAFDYLLKPFEIPELLSLVAKAVACSRLMSQPVELGIRNTTRDTIIGHSRAMQTIYKEIGRIAEKPVNVLIRGETGTGKELIARAIYHHSTRSQEPFIAINCAAIPETLLESELFGHERGAFTGAESRRIGRFEQANQGTLFLDEIGDLSPLTQVKLLRVLQESTIQRVGGKEDIPINVRVIAATHRDLEAAVQHAQFRADLFYRLNVVAIHLPPLRDHKEDIPDLVYYFLQKHGPELGASDHPEITPEAIALLQAQSWPGNVRELENVVRKTLLLSQGYTISQDHIRLAIARPGIAASRIGDAVRQYIAEILMAAQLKELSAPYDHIVDEIEREIFTQAIQLAGGNQAQAARLLGISRLTMQRKLTRFGLHPHPPGSLPPS